MKLNPWEFRIAVARADVRQLELATRIGVAPTKLSRLVHGHVRGPEAAASIATLERALGLPEHVLVAAEIASSGTHECEVNHDGLPVGLVRTLPFAR